MNALELNKSADDFGRPLDEVPASQRLTPLSQMLSTNLVPVPS